MYGKCTVVERDQAFRQNLSAYDVIAIYTQGGSLTLPEERNLISFIKEPLLLLYFLLF